MKPSEKIVRANGVDLCVQTFGDRSDPPILLIHGAAASMLAWEEEFCERLAAGSRFVTRYDHRDTGRSVSYEPGAPPYTLRDLTADALGLLDAFGLSSAHLVGRSMGGGIAMLAALDYPDRVASLTLVGTSPGGPDLPPMSEEFLAHISGEKNPDWSDREAVIDHVVGMLRVFSGGSGHLDEAAMRDLVGYDVDRTVNVASSQMNHFSMSPGEPVRDRLGEIGVPTLVIHGAEDPVFPLGHAVALEKEIPGARLLALEQTGHELPRAVWDVVVPAILEHTSGGRLRHEKSRPSSSNEPGSDLPSGLGKPARRALARAGYTRLEQFTTVSEAEILELHGMGPRALDQIRRALAARGRSFADARRG